MRSEGNTKLSSHMIDVFYVYKTLTDCLRVFSQLIPVCFSLQIYVTFVSALLLQYTGQGQGRLHVRDLHKWGPSTLDIIISFFKMPLCAGSVPISFYHFLTVLVALTSTTQITLSTTLPSYVTPVAFVLGWHLEYSMWCVGSTTSF